MHSTVGQARCMAAQALQTKRHRPIRRPQHQTKDVDVSTSNPSTCSAKGAHTADAHAIQLSFDVLQTHALPAELAPAGRRCPGWHAGQNDLYVLTFAVAWPRRREKMMLDEAFADSMRVRANQITARLFHPNPMSPPLIRGRWRSVGRNLFHKNSSQHVLPRMCTCPTASDWHATHKTLKSSKSELDPTLQYSHAPNNWRATSHDAHTPNLVKLLNQPRNDKPTPSSSRRKLLSDVERDWKLGYRRRSKLKMFYRCSAIQYRLKIEAGAEKKTHLGVVN